MGKFEFQKSISFDPLAVQKKTVLHFLPSGVILYTEKVWTKSETDRMGHSGCKIKRSLKDDMVMCLV